MISKRIHCKKENDNYKRLANYIADASHNGEKSLVSWCTGAWAGDDYELGIQEVIDTQSLNMRSAKEKTYHMLVSFRVEDEGKLTNEDFKKIEERFAKVLGFEEHQRHCGVHINTDNMHMHVAYNMINPETLARHEPYRDYKKRDALCRELEKEFGLSIDNGIDTELKDKIDTPKLSEQAKKMEILRGEESFESYALRNKVTIMEGIKKANSWHDVHEELAKFSLELKPKANGFIIKNKHESQSIKASKFDRSMSFKKLNDRFGKFVPPKKVVLGQEKYQKNPIQKSEHTQKLWAEFAKESQLNDIEKIKEKWRKEWHRKSKANMTLREQRALFNEISNKRNREINNLKIQQKVSNQNWIEFLQAKAKQGDEEALDVLRSSNKKEELVISAKGKQLENLQAKEITYSIKEKAQKQTMDYKRQKKLINVETMQKVMGNNFEHDITRHGVAIFKLANGDKVIDYGKEISFTGTANEIAVDYASQKWGMRKLTTNERAYINPNNQKITIDSLTNAIKNCFCKYTMQKIVGKTFNHDTSQHGVDIFTLDNGEQIIDYGKEISFTGTAKDIALDYASQKWGMRNLTNNEKSLVNLEKNEINFENLVNAQNSKKERTLNSTHKKKEQGLER